MAEAASLEFSLSLWDDSLLVAPVFALPLAKYCSNSALDSTLFDDILVAAVLWASPEAFDPLDFLDLKDLLARDDGLY